MVSRRVRRVGNSLRRDTGSVVRRLTLDITDRLIKTTPVDTGFARASWIPNVGAPALEPPEGSPPVTQQQAGIRSVLLNASATSVVHITNNTEYIGFLNEGSSPQAPPGFVQDAVDKAIEVEKSRRGV